MRLITASVAVSLLFLAGSRHAGAVCEGAIMHGDVARAEQQKDFVSMNEILRYRFLKDDRSAGYWLGKNYEAGNGVGKNELVAYFYYKISALKGEGVSQLQIARFYEEGIVVKKNAIKSYVWYSLARSSMGGCNIPKIDEIAKLFSDEEREIALRISHDCKLSGMFRQYDGCPIDDFE